MSAERLQDAATLLREVAGDAAFLSHEEWSTDGHQVISGSAGWCLVAVTSDESADDRTSRFIATMDPGVALALADWLDDLADHDPSPLMPTEAGAFKVADAVLGGEES